MGSLHAWDRSVRSSLGPQVVTDSYQNLRFHRASNTAGGQSFHDHRRASAGAPDHLKASLGDESGDDPVETGLLYSQFSSKRLLVEEDTSGVLTRFAGKETVNQDEDIGRITVATRRFHIVVFGCFGVTSERTLLALAACNSQLLHSTWCERALGVRILHRKTVKVKPPFAIVTCATDGPAKPPIRDFSLGRRNHPCQSYTSTFAGSNQSAASPVGARRSAYDRPPPEGRADRARCQFQRGPYLTPREVDPRSPRNRTARSARG